MFGLPSIQTREQRLGELRVGSEHNGFVELRPVRGSLCASWLLVNKPQCFVPDSCAFLVPVVEVAAIREEYLALGPLHKEVQLAEASAAPKLEAATPPQKFILTLDDARDVPLLSAWCAIGRCLSHQDIKGALSLVPDAIAAHGPGDTRCNRVSKAIAKITEAPLNEPPK